VRLVFCGTALFAVASLRACAAHHEVLAVVTRADRLGNRGQPAPRPVADAAHELDLPVLMPAKIGAPDVVRGLLDLIPDCVVVAAYGQILPITLLDPLPFGAVNVHASLLPRWRGAAPIARAILAGDAETGVSIMRMEAGLDTGPVYAMAHVPIGLDATTPALASVLADLGARELVSVLEALEHGSATATPQPEEGMTYAARLTREDGRVDWSARSAVEVDRMVRALIPWPGVLAPIDGIEVQIQAGGVADMPVAADPGTIDRREGESVVIATRDGGYRVDMITPPGKRAMTPAAFLRGRQSSKAAH
jgi:methionyl-tRNA formyltransferase